MAVAYPEEAHYGFPVKGEPAAENCTPLPPPWPAWQDGQRISTRCCCKGEGGDCACFEIEWEWRPVADTDRSDGHYAWHEVSEKTQSENIDCDTVRTGCSVLVPVIECPPERVRREALDVATNEIFDTEPMLIDDYSVDAVKVRIPEPEAEQPAEEEPEEEPQLDLVKPSSREVESNTCGPDISGWLNEEALIWMDYGKRLARAIRETTLL